MLPPTKTSVKPLSTTAALVAGGAGGAVHATREAPQTWAPTAPVRAGSSADGAKCGCSTRYSRRPEVSRRAEGGEGPRAVDDEHVLADGHRRPEGRASPPPPAHRPG